MSTQLTIPPVCVGLPVRNGGSLLAGALEGLIRQTDPNFEIVISDNASTDETERICSDFASLDARIKYFRQPTLVTALSNFRFVFDQCRSPYFMWASHDDRHSENYIETLRKCLDEHPDAALAFTDCQFFNSHEKVCPIDYHTEPRTKVSSIRGNLASPMFATHMYAMIRAEALRDYKWYEIDYGPDHVILNFLAFKGDFVYSAGAKFLYFHIEKDPKDRALANSLHSLRPFSNTRLAWTIARAVVDAKRSQGERVNIIQVLPFTLYRSGKKSVYERLPASVRKAWHWFRSN